MLKKIKKHHKIFLFILNIFLFFIIGIFYYLIQPFKSESVVYIPKGSVSEIIQNLANNNYPVGKIDKYILYFLGYPQSGWINIGEAPLNKAEFLHKLTTAKAAEQKITLIPGETTLYFFKELASKLNLSEEKLLKAYEAQTNYPEGMLFPETYNIPKGIKEDLLIKLLLTHSKNESQKAATKIFGAYNEKKWHNFVIMASVIQKEAANEAEMPIVASVIYNRLRLGMKLQMDGTLNYGLYSHTKITPERIRNDESSYNTYKHAGLPKEAVCNVSLAAIKAAIFPAKTEYLYFMRDKKTGLHVFTTNVNDHNKVVAAQR